ncbi:MAG TPA: tRNA lysidine(34) synthetase TilS [Bacillota bacterium]|nr:tRNA lysidine(34) synthetase TilS [Bacillota bacterium]
MKNKVVTFIEKFNLLQKGTTVLVGVSGGPDSMALLHLLVSLRDKWDLRIIALTLDHQLRGDQSAKDVTYVKNIAYMWDVEVIYEKLNVREFQERENVSKQVASRKLRYKFYKEQMRRFDADYLALGHHQDDQVETMLMSLTRSASSNAFLGIPVQRNFSTGVIIRPLLAVTKDDITTYCAEHHIEARFDPSNIDLSDRRVYVRKKVVPLLKEKNPNIYNTMQRLSETIHEDEQFLQTEAKKVLTEQVTFDVKERKASFHIDKFKQYANPLQRRAFHLILNYLYNEEIPKDMSYIHEEDFFSLLERTDGTKTLHFPNNLHIERSYEVVSFYFSKEKKESKSSQIISIPGKMILPNGWELTAEYTEEKDVSSNRYTFCVPKESVKLPLQVRMRQPGDRISLPGLQGRKRVAQLFIDEKIPKHERDHWPIVVEQDNTVLWVIGLRKSEERDKKQGNLWIKLQVKKQGE